MSQDPNLSKCNKIDAKYEYIPVLALVKQPDDISVTSSAMYADQFDVLDYIYIIHI